MASPSAPGFPTLQDTGGVFPMEHSREAPPGLRGTAEAGFIAQWEPQSLGEPEDVSNVQRAGAVGWGSQDGGRGSARQLWD